LPNEPVGFDEETKRRLSKMADDWVSNRHYDCLINACSLLLGEKGNQASPLNKIAIEFIRQSSAGLQKGKDGQAKDPRSLACSFCGKAAPEVRLGAGPEVFICNECVATFHSILCSDREDSLI
jgi:hypothetical protein